MKALHCLATTCFIICVLGFPSAAVASSLFVESITVDSLLLDSWEFVSYEDDSRIGLAGIRFTVVEPVVISTSSANVFTPFGGSSRVFMGIEQLAGPLDFPTFVPDAGVSSLLAYAEGQATAVPGSEVMFSLNASLDPGVYALLLGCVEADCYGALPVGAPGTTPSISENDFLISFGTTSSQGWSYSSHPLRPTFRVALFAVPEPRTNILVGFGLLAVAMFARRPTNGCS